MRQERHRELVGPIGGVPVSATALTLQKSCKASGEHWRFAVPADAVPRLR